MFENISMFENIMKMGISAVVVAFIIVIITIALGIFVIIKSVDAQKQCMELGYPQSRIFLDGSIYCNNVTEVYKIE